MKTITRHHRLRGTLTVPGDKSISHRAVMFGALAEGVTTIHGFLNGADCLSTIDCFRKMGVAIEEKEDEIFVHGKGLYGLQAPDAPLYVGNSGTTTRLISGILAGQTFSRRIKWRRFFKFPSHEQGHRPPHPHGRGNRQPESRWLCAADDSGHTASRDPL